MRLVPKAYEKKILFFATRVEKWAERAEEIGASPEVVAQLEAITLEAQEALRAERAARAAAMTARQRLGNVTREMGQIGAAVIQQVRSRAQISGAEVYSLALIPAPKPRAPIGPPGKPEKFTAELTTIGSLVLRWNCRNPRGSVGTVYQIWRRIDGGKLEYCGQSGQKRFTDAKVPSGVSGITYQIHAARSTAKGLWASFDVRFGTSHLGPALLAVIEQQSNPLAA